MQPETTLIALVSTLAAAIVAAWVAIKKQRDADDNSATKRWKFYAKHLEDVIEQLRTESTVGQRRATEDAVTIAVLRERQQEAEHSGNPKRDAEPGPTPEPGSGHPEQPPTGGPPRV